ncbi:hypothetical protein [Flavobacterium sp. ov086]|uniref:hypothetical protein n=1 Tax=Flavobacterium sp. ov086 TaxID=1761785 RepID=UPI000B64D4FA|nr:hypothetical protein [Flavobacterium sp. ov086]SNR62646.1 hypothetical protein SAMN04487979_11442 [Flavobacterium sp. ov086]
MEEWEPISLKELNNEILKTEKDLDEELKNFWNLIKIDPVKWSEEKYGELGGGFWVVGIFGHQVIWYNDIEEGFNISDYKTFGEIEDYWCNQDELVHVIYRLFELIKFGGELTRREGPSPNLIE